ncbi:MAG TPA: CDP-alcohol phosphatidyltransferase family protein [Anaerolineae bacterium]|nr:CDP-alcohol phosphatidyltransferase family protein [Anaerolineae bacterium]
MSFIEQKAREVSRPTLEGVGRVLTRWHISPDAITYLGLLLTAGVALLLALGYTSWGGLAYIVAAVCDAMDGTLARVSGRGSRFGAFLDSTIDRFEESMVFLGLIIYYARVGGPIEIPLLLVATSASLMVSYTKARAEGLAIPCNVGILSRPPRVAILIVALILNQVLVGLIILAPLSLFTSFQRMVHVWRATGGQASGWALPPKPYVAPGLAVPEATKEADKPGTAS